MYNYSNYYGFWNLSRVFHDLLAALAQIKFAFVAVCSVVALVSYFLCRSKKDWFWLTLGLAFTVGADYLLILHNRHLTGVAVFCFAHVAYIIRAVTGKPDGMRRIFPWLAVLMVGLVYTVLTIFLIDMLNWINADLVVFRFATSIYVIAALYAALFITNIYVSARYLRHNRVLIVVGLLLFAFCDIFVLIFNLPLYFGAPEGLSMVFPLIWVFYLPSQALLALSAVNFSRIFPHTQTLVN